MNARVSRPGRLTGQPSSRFAAALPAADSARLRVATYNIHKGVRGVGPRKRLEIHNLGLGVEALDADLVFLQEVRLFHRADSRRFDRTWFGWPEQGQAEYLAPEGYEVAYRTNAITRQGEHGNALLSRWPMGEVDHHDVSAHAFEQRGLLHVPVQWSGRTIHTVVAHFGLTHGARLQQVQYLARFVKEFVPRGAPLLVAGDFNDWGERLDAPMRSIGLARAGGHAGGVRPRPTFPSRVPVFALDRVYMRGFRCVTLEVPRGAAWARMSDHLPLVVELEPT
ncbi:MAG: endonuclease/exonuclease/phosphatase family protein [Ideonella sp.]|nr:endonuclease/exonuclease/phosphatase family protein [Ideonella sp.]MCC7455529.1 endonuclease/exonuclease/phosphatase family protein [Nitrospira sp.]